MSTAPKPSRRQRPSEDLAILRSQLRQALEELGDDDDGPRAQNYRRFVHRAMAKAWRAAVAGEGEIVAEVIEIFREARPMVDDALPLLEPRAGAAVEMQQMLAVLYLGEGELRKVERENRLTDRGRHPTERGVLEVLVAAKRPLRQKEVFERMTASARPSPARIGQILRELFRDRYLQKQLGRARGRSEVAHYHLSPRGRDLCKQAGIHPPRVAALTPRAQPPVVLTVHASDTVPPPAMERPAMAALAQAWVDPNWMLGRVANGIIESTPDRDLARSCLTQISAASPTSGNLSDPRIRGALKNELAKELNLIEVASESDVFDEVRLVTAR